MAAAASSNGFLKSLIIMGIVAMLVFGWFSVNLFNAHFPIPIAKLLKSSEKIKTKIEEIKPEKASPLPDELRASAQIDWSILYGGTEAARNKIALAIAEASSTFAVDADLLRAIIMAESVFNPNAVSSKGARGLMQLMPATAEDLGVFNPEDPRENIMAGAEYVAALLKEFNGNTRLAIAAYNVGPQAVHNSNDTTPAEILPYVNRVMSYYHFFSGTKSY